MPPAINFRRQVSLMTTSSGSSSSANLYQDVGDNPNQPRRFSFPKQQYGKTKVVHRAFQPQWFEKWKWLHYDESRDLAFCHTCLIAMKTGKMKDKNTYADPAFVYKGYSNWKDATGERGTFNVHANSKFHKACTEVAIDLSRTTRDVGKLLSSAYAQEKTKNRTYYLAHFC